MNNYEVWYQLPGTVRYAPSVDFSRLMETHVPVMQLTADDMEEVWVFMQGYNWSPNGEAREGIVSLGLAHTSMSVGDVVYNMDTGEWFQVDIIGFELIGTDSKEE